MGVYAIAAFSARVRRRELAIRAAFGASRGALARVVFLEELRPVAVGIVAGLITASETSRLFSGLVFAVSPTDPWTYLDVAVGLLSVSALAIFLPARRAGLIDPAELLRG